MNPSKRVDNKEPIANSGHVQKGLKGDEPSISSTRGKHNTVLLLIYEFTLKVCGSAFKFAQFRRASAFICSDVLSERGAKKISKYVEASKNTS